MIDIVTIGKRQIAVRGIGRLFYQDGFPITMSIQCLKEKNIEISILHIVDELIKHGWSNKTILNTIIYNFLNIYTLIKIQSYICLFKKLFLYL